MNLYGMTNVDLLLCYTLMVQHDHYDPFDTPLQVVRWREHFTTDDVERVILQRMSLAGPTESE